MHFVYTEGTHANITPKAMRAARNQIFSISSYCLSRQLTGTVQYMDYYLGLTLLASSYVCHASKCLGWYMHSYVYCHESRSLPYMMREGKQTRRHTHTIHSWLSYISGVKEKIPHIFTNCNRKNLTNKTFDPSLQGQHRCNTFNDAWDQGPESWAPKWNAAIIYIIHLCFSYNKTNGLKMGLKWSKQIITLHSTRTQPSITSMLKLCSILLLYCC